MRAPAAVHFVDLHTHILPGIDDGPPSLEAALQMLQLAHRSGTRVMVATPHMFLPPYNNNDLVPINDAFAKTLRELGRRSGQPGFSFLEEMSFYLGAENYLSPEFLEALESGRVLSMNGGRYLLVEFSAFLSFEMLTSAIERIVASGFVPILAHVERYPPFCDKTGKLAQVLRMGCVAQLNGASLLGTEGRPRRRVARSLLRRGLVHVIASDAHDSRARTPALSAVFEILRKKFPEDKIRAWMLDNPRRILENQGLG